MTIDPRGAAEEWLGAFAAAVSTRDGAALRTLFHADSYWRDLVALSGRIRTVAGVDNLVATLLPLADAARPVGFRLSPAHHEPSLQPRGDRRPIEAFFEFETGEVRGEGIVRLTPVPSDPSALRAWALMTSARELKGHEEPSVERRPDYDRGPAQWSEGKDLDVLIVGSGQSGLCLAARLQLMGVATLVVEKNVRVGDNWRKRYHSLSLHNEIVLNEFPFMPFPSSWPTYLSKEMYGRWLEMFATGMDVTVRTGVTFVGGDFDAVDGRWSVRLDRSDGSEQVLRPRHVVLATGGYAGVPKIPDIPGLAEFTGTTLHSTEVRTGADFANQRVLIIGTGVSAHDLAVELVANGCRVTMVQRAPTDVVSLEAANSFFDLYHERSVEEVDLILAANSADVTRTSLRQLEKKAAERDRLLIDELEAVGFRTCRGVDEAGFFWDFLQRGGGYYIDVGGSRYVIDGTVRVVQSADVSRYGRDGAYLADGTVIEADTIVLATGFSSQELEVRRLFGEEVADKIGPIWGVGEEGELRNTWMPTAQEGLWFMGGAIPQARAYSRYLALQITARLLGLRIGAPDVPAAQPAWAT